MFGKGYFKAGFNGWFQGVLNPMVKGHPGKMTLVMSRAGITIDSARATVEISQATASITLGLG